MATLAHEVTWDIANAWESYYSSAVLSGIVGDEAHKQRNSYHNSLEDNPDQDGFSNDRPDDAAPPGNWPRNLAAAIDMSMSPTDMATCSSRLWNVWNDKSDPRRNYINAFNGWFNDGGPAKRYDFVTGPPGGISETSSDHKWHVHLSIRRRYVTDWNAAGAIKSILRGESKDQHLQGSAGEEDMYAKHGMGLNGTPISHNTLYLQRQMHLLLDDNDPRLVDHPLTIDGKYGNNTAYWVSVLLMGGEGKEVGGDWFSALDEMVADSRIAAAGSSGGTGGLVPHTHSIPGLSVTVSGDVTGTGNTNTSNTGDAVASQ